MEMIVDLKLVKSERTRRAWSQDHLATVSGLSLRTIQRIEKTGSASFESAQALASVFSIDVAELRKQTETQQPTLRWQRVRRSALGATGLAALATMSLFTVSSTFAEPILLDFDISRVDLSNNDENRKIGQLLIEVGKAAEIRVSSDSGKSFHFLIVPHKN